MKTSNRGRDTRVKVDEFFMNLYINQLPKNKYKLLNRFWIELGMESPHIVGLLFVLIERDAFSSWEKWREYYFKSGKMRLSLLEKFSIEFKKRVLSPDNFHKNEIKWPVYKLNYFYGRTQKEVIEIIQSLYIKSAGEYNGQAMITYEEVEDFVNYKLFGAPWNYSQLRYTKTIKTILNQIPNLEIKRARLEFVGEFGFQGLITKNGKPRAGIGVSSPGWLKQTNLLHQQRVERKEKNDLYKETFGSDIYHFYATLDGTIINNHEEVRLIQNSYKYIPESISRN